MSSRALQTAVESIPIHYPHHPIIEITTEGVSMAGTLDEASARTSGARHAHGGAAATLLDTAAVAAAMASTGRPWMTVDMRIDYLRPLALGPFTVSGRIIGGGTKILRASGQLYDHDGRLCAMTIATLA